jgi:hypothetical protein
MFAAIPRASLRRAFAKHHGVNRAYLNMILNGRRPVSDSITEVLGLHKVYIAQSQRRTGRKRQARPLPPGQSALGHKRTWRHVRSMSALPPKADIRPGGSDVRLGPEADNRCHSITSSVELPMESSRPEQQMPKQARAILRLRPGDSFRQAEAL